MVMQGNRPRAQNIGEPTDDAAAMAPPSDPDNQTVGFPTLKQALSLTYEPGNGRPLSGSGPSSERVSPSRKSSKEEDEGGGKTSLEGDYFAAEFSGKGTPRPDMSSLKDGAGTAEMMRMGSGNRGRNPSVSAYSISGTFPSNDGQPTTPSAGLAPSAAAASSGHVSSGSTNRASAPTHVPLPKIPDRAETALAALQYLPTPILVLSSLKTVLFANDAMVKLLGLERSNVDLGKMKKSQTGKAQLDGIEEEEEEDEDDEDEISYTDLLRGQTLSQIGIDMIQDGQPVWVNWETYLDSLGNQMDGRAEEAVTSSRLTDTHYFVGNERATPPTERSEHRRSTPHHRKSHSSSGNQRPRPIVHDSVVEVVLFSQRIGSSPAHSRHQASASPAQERKGVISRQNSGPGGLASSQYSSASSPSSMGHVQARMVISIWTMDGQRFFTLSFTSGASDRSTPYTVRQQSRMVSRRPANASLSPSELASHPSNSPSAGEHPKNCAHCGGMSSSTAALATSAGTLASSARTSPSDVPLNISPFPLSNIVSAPSALQKTLKMKDAMINAMQVPVISMWKDGSLALPNRAALRLVESLPDPASENYHDLLARLDIYTVDFGRRLERSEIPIAELCRTQKPFESRLVGVKVPKRGKLVFDVSGDAIYDDAGNFVGGMTVFRDVTELTDQLKHQSEQSELQFELICDTMPQMLWVTTPDGWNMSYFSQRWYDYTGMDPDSSIGMGWQKTFHPDDLGRVNELWAECLESGEEFSAEYRLRRKDGKYRWMLCHARPLRDAKTDGVLKWFGTCTDVHDQVVAREQARHFREQLVSVIKHGGLTMWTIDHRRRITFVEGQLMWLLEGDNKVSSDVIGKNIYDAFNNHPARFDLKEYLKPVEDILDGNTRMQSFYENHVEGTDRYFRTRFVPMFGRKEQRPDGTSVTNPDKIEGVVAISLDVSELRRREADLEVQEKENLRLLSAETAAKEASRLKSQFLANMSHEIRTPIAGVIGMAELLTDTNLDEEQEECVENIQRSANGLLTVINDILDLSKVESGRLDVEEVSFSLSLVIKDVGKLMSFAAQRKDLQYVEDVQIGKDADDLIVLGDPGRCRQILTNLLTNSIKFTSEGYVKLSVVVKDETDDTVTVMFTVEDTGIGIEEEVRKKLFKPFSQADSSTARRFGGTGLGLTICRNLVELMHGEISLDSILGSGTMATFTIPFSKPPFGGAGKPLVRLGSQQNISDRLRSELSVSGGTRTAGAAGSDRERSPQGSIDANSSLAKSKRGSVLTGSETSQQPEAEQNLTEEEKSKTHVLVVEDNAINQQIALKTIKKLGFSVSAVWNGKEALDYLLKSSGPPTPTTNSKGSNSTTDAAEEPRPDLILMDVQMPVLDGYRATHLIRHHDPFSSLPGMQTVPIVAMTASAIQGDREKCERAGMDDYLAKPVRVKDLEQMLVKWTARGKEGARARLPQHHVTDHDSNCVEIDRLSLSTDGNHQQLAPAAHNKSSSTDGDTDHGSGANPISPTNPNSASSAAARMMLPAFPQGESEGDRGLRRVAAEEKAEELRNDKLLIAASESGSAGRPHRHHVDHHDGSNYFPRPHGGQHQQQQQYPHPHPYGKEGGGVAASSSGASGSGGMPVSPGGGPSDGSTATDEEHVSRLTQANMELLGREQAQRDAESILRGDGATRNEDGGGGGGADDPPLLVADPEEEEDEEERAGAVGRGALRHLSSVSGSASASSSVRSKASSKRLPIERHNSGTSQTTVKAS